MKNVSINPKVDYRLIVTNEVGLIPSLHRKVFPQHHWRRSIFASDKIVNYLTNLLAFPHLQNEHVLIGAWYQDMLIGYAHFRALLHTWHLNYIAVALPYQQQGIGRALFNRWFETGQQRGYKLFSLDVDASNHSVVAWYTKEGFETVAKTWVYDRILLSNHQVPMPKVKVQLCDWVLAEASHSLYGFSQFSLKLADEYWKVGRLGEDYFQVTGDFPEILENVLITIDAKRRLLQLSPQPLAEQNLKEVTVSLRMQRDIKPIIQGE